MTKLQNIKFFAAILLGFCLLFVAVSGNAVFARTFEDLNLPQEKVNPNHVAYPIKRLWEKFQEKTTRKHEKKVSFYETLIEKRLSELGYIAKSKNIGQVQKASERFSYFSGVLTEYLIEQEGAGEDKKRLTEKFASYKEPLSELRDEFPANSSDWMMISYCIDSLEIYSSQLNE